MICQLSLPHDAITKNIMGELKTKKENLRSVRSSWKTMESVSWGKRVYIWNDCGKIGFKMEVIESEL